MGTPKLLTRFREYCEAYWAQYAIEGVVESIQPLEPIEPEHPHRGMSVHTTEGSGFVQFESERTPPVAVGDTVIVVGKDGWRGENSILPAVLFDPTERYAWFSTDLRPRTKRSEVLWGDTVLFAVGFSIFLIVQQIAPLERLWIYVISFLVFFGALFSELLVLKYNKRPRSYQCDEKTWHALTAEVAERFGIKTSV